MMGKIEWTDRSDWNPLRGCTRVSEGCRNCYAEGMAGRFSKPGQWGHGFAERTAAGGRWTGKVALQDDRLTLPLRWRKPAKVFVSSTSDVFHEALLDEAIDCIFAVMALCPHLTFQVLTKRAERMRRWASDSARPGRIARLALDMVIVGTVPVAAMGLESWPVASVGPDSDNPDDVTLKRWPLPNVWLGVSAEDQQRADERIPHLLATPAAVRFVSCEPLLGPIDLTELPFTKDCDCDGHSPHLNAFTAGVFCEGCCEGPERLNYGTIDWVIAGGESGPRARPVHPNWVRCLRDQCAGWDVPFFFKQWGEWAPGEVAGGPQTGTEHVAKWFGGKWSFDTVTPKVGESMHCDDEPDVWRLGKARAGALLDGREHKEFPVI